MMAVTTYECTGREMGDLVELYLPAFSGNKVVDVIGELGKSLLPSQCSVEENTGKLTINYAVQRGYRYSVLYKTLPRTGSGIVDVPVTGGGTTMTDFESADFESADFT